MPGETISALTPAQAPARVRSASAIAVGLGARPRRLAVVPGDDLGAAGAQRRDRRQAGPPEPEHRDPVPGIAADRDHGAGSASAASTKSARAAIPACGTTTGS